MNEIQIVDGEIIFENSGLFTKLNLESVKNIQSHLLYDTNELCGTIDKEGNLIICRDDLKKEAFSCASKAQLECWHTHPLLTFALVPSSDDILISLENNFIHYIFTPYGIITIFSKYKYDGFTEDIRQKFEMWIEFITTYYVSFILSSVLTELKKLQMFSPPTPFNFSIFDKLLENFLTFINQKFSELNIDIQFKIYKYPLDISKQFILDRMVENNIKTRLDISKSNLLDVQVNTWKTAGLILLSKSVSLFPELSILRTILTPKIKSIYFYDIQQLLHYIRLFPITELLKSPLFDKQYFFLYFNISPIEDKDVIEIYDILLSQYTNKEVDFAIHSSIICVHSSLNFTIKCQGKAIRKRKKYEFLYNKYSYNLYKNYLDLFAEEKTTEFERRIEFENKESLLLVSHKRFESFLNDLKFIDDKVNSLYANLTSDVNNEKYTEIKSLYNSILEIFDTEKSFRDLKFYSTNIEIVFKKIVSILRILYRLEKNLQFETYQDYFEMYQNDYISPNLWYHYYTVLKDALSR